MSDYITLNYVKTSIKENCLSIDECNHIIDVVNKYKEKIENHEKNKKYKYRDYVPKKYISNYDDTIINMITENTVVFPPNKSYVKINVCRCCYDDYDICDDNNKYFVCNYKYNNYTWENMKIFFDFDI